MALHPIQLLIGSASHYETILHGQGLLQQKAPPVLLTARDLAPVAVCPDGDHMIMPSVYIVMPVDGIRLLGITQSFHDILNQLLHLLLTYPIGS